MCVRSVLVCWVMHGDERSEKIIMHRKRTTWRKDLCDFKEFFKDPDDNHHVSSNKKKAL